MNTDTDIKIYPIKIYPIKMDYFNNLRLQVFVSFASGLLLSPLSYGFVYYIIFLIIYEGVFYMYNPNRYINYQRVLIFLVSLVGFIIGRVLFYPKDDPIQFQSKIDWKEVFQKLINKLK